LNAVFQGVRGLVLTRAGRPLAALAAYDRVLVLEPKFQWVHRNRAWSLARLGREDEAAETFYLETRGVGEAPEHLTTLRQAIDERGLAGYWAWRYDRMVALRASGATVRPMQWAEALAAVGRNEEALAALATAANTQDGEYFYYFRDSQAFDRLRDDPRFAAFWPRGAGGGSAAHRSAASG
jgi:predicted Zn-dependent protease